MLGMPVPAASWMKMVSISTGSVMLKVKVAPAAVVLRSKSPLRPRSTYSRGMVFGESVCPAQALHWLK